MGLTTSQVATFTRIKTTSGSRQAVRLTDDTLRELILLAARDLAVADQFQDVEGEIRELFDPEFGLNSALPGPAPRVLFERLCSLKSDGDTYVWCLASIHKARLKYGRVLSTQMFATMEQVGLRGLLQYGLMEASTLAGFMIWRKWAFDIDNRAAQETGYLVEPVIATALGGVSYTASKSPIRRVLNPTKGRQVDCVKDTRAYEFKIRVTIAASGQGRWPEELSYAKDCQASGYVPVLLVFDATENERLTELAAAFRDAGGECYLGDQAWTHLRAEAQPDMQLFLQRYIETPLRHLSTALGPTQPLPDFQMRDSGTSVDVSIGERSWRIPRDVAADATPPIEDQTLDDDGDTLSLF